MTKEKNTVNVGIVGCGGIARQKHMPALNASGKARIVACCNRTEETARQAAADFGPPGAAVYTDWRELLADPDVEAVNICTANDTHAPIAIAALEAGKHVLCEKPMALTAAQAQAMAAAAQKSGAKLSVSYQNRFRPEVRELHRRCRAGELGEIYYAKALAVRRRGIPTWGEFLSLEKQGGGCLIDVGTHVLDQTLWLMDNYEVAAVTGAVYHHLGRGEATANPWGKWDPAAFEVEDAAFAMIRMKNGATLQLECSWALNTLEVREGKTVLCGTRGGADLLDGLRLNGEEGGVLYEKRPDPGNLSGLQWTPRNVDQSDPGQLECDSWLTALLEDTEPVVTAAQGVVVCQVIDAIYESARTGKTIHF